jgi:nitrogen regulatory protein PII
MKLKLIVALVSDDKTDVVVDAARAGGATGATIITSVRGEGLQPGKTFFGLRLEGMRNMVLFLVLETRARDILERIHDAARFDTEHGAGIAFQLDIEDAVGLGTQLPAILDELEYHL